MERETSDFEKWLKETLKEVAPSSFSESLATVAHSLYRLFSARVRFAEMLGRRCSFIAGEVSDEPTCTLPDYIQLTENIILIVDAWGKLGNEEKEKLIKFLKEVVKWKRLQQEISDVASVEKILSGDEDSLLRCADFARRAYCGDAVHIRGIIEYSNICSRNCLYCGLRKDNKNLKRYTMTVEEILDTAAQGFDNGIRTFVLQSGENDSEPPEFLASVIKALKKNFDVAVTLSAGVKRAEAYRIWKEAGADRYLLKFETSSPSLFKRLCSGSVLQNRLSALESLRQLEYQIGSGSIIGLPNQTLSDVAQDIVFAKGLDLDMAAFGPFVPSPHTPFAKCHPGDVALSLRVIAVARLLLGDVHIAAASSLDALAPNGRQRALSCGANVIMANLTPESYSNLYGIYPRQNGSSSLKRITEIVSHLGYSIASDRGDSIKQFRRRKNGKVTQRS
ncbi:MAG: [FeFe] hydrogenase H-cluster radical SAM maturase HydE [Planctomycetota bacterium]|nr:[FeFe] hydrogenase H-cluster radical SAM maturase HydE [Planctomycetota bacterium]